MRLFLLVLRCFEFCIWTWIISIQVSSRCSHWAVCREPQCKIDLLGKKHLYRSFYRVSCWRCFWSCATTTTGVKWLLLKEEEWNLQLKAAGTTLRAPVFPFNFAGGVFSPRGVFLTTDITISYVTWEHKHMTFWYLTPWTGTRQTTSINVKFMAQSIPAMIPPNKIILQYTR